MNIFKALFSGYRSYKEEFSSQLLAFFISPHMPHGFGDRILKVFLREIGENNLCDGDITIEETDIYCHDIKKNLTAGNFPAFAIEIEAAPTNKSKGRIDILLQIEKNVFVIENKIYSGSVGDLKNQINGYMKEFEELNTSDAVKFTSIAILPFDEKYGWDGKCCSWENLAKKLKEECNKISEAPGKTLLNDFCDYIRTNYASYRSENSASAHEMLDYVEFLDRASEGIDAQKASIETILTFWHEEVNKAFNPHDKVYDGAIMFVPDSKGIPVYPFKISCAGSFILQHNAMHKKYDEAYFEIRKKLIECKIFLENKSSCSIASLNKEKLEKLKTILSESKEIIAKTNAS